MKKTTSECIHEVHLEECGECGRLLTVIETSAMAKLTSKLARMEAAERWIPVSERLPEIDGEYICYNGKSFDVDYWDGDSWNFNCGITHWRPLPSAPEVRG